MNYNIQKEEKNLQILIATVVVSAILMALLTALLMVPFEWEVFGYFENPMKNLSSLLLKLLFLMIFLLFLGGKLLESAFTLRNVVLIIFSEVLISVLISGFAIIGGIVILIFLAHIPIMTEIILDNLKLMSLGVALLIQIPLLYYTTVKENRIINSGLAAIGYTPQPLSREIIKKFHKDTAIEQFFGIASFLVAIAWFNNDSFDNSSSELSKFFGHNWLLVIGSFSILSSCIVLHLLKGTSFSIKNIK